MKISEFSKLIYFLNIIDLEKLILEATKNGYIDCRVDHQRGILIFKPQVIF